MANKRKTKKSKKVVSVTPHISAMGFSPAQLTALLKAVANAQTK